MARRGHAARAGARSEVVEVARKGSSKRKPLKVRSNGRLRQAAGTTKSGKVNKTKARKLAKGSGVTAKRARFYLNVLSKGGKKKGKRKGR